MWGTPLPSSSPRDPHLCSRGVVAGALAWESSWTPAHCALSGLRCPEPCVQGLTASPSGTSQGAGTRPTNKLWKQDPRLCPLQCPTLNLRLSQGRVPATPALVRWRPWCPGYLVTYDRMGPTELKAVTASDLLGVLMPGARRQRKEFLFGGGWSTPDVAAGALGHLSNRLPSPSPIASCKDCGWPALKGTLMYGTPSRAGAELSAAQGGLYPTRLLHSRKSLGFASSSGASGVNTTSGCGQLQAPGLAMPHPKPVGHLASLPWGFCDAQCDAPFPTPGTHPPVTHAQL